MTENESIETLKLNRPFAYTELQNAVDMAIQALAEIQQYRAIGTVDDYWKLNEMCKEYSAIGTIEEFKALKEKNEPKKPRFYAHNYHCIECGNLVGNNEFEWQRFLYCDNCGTKIDWQ